MLPNRLLFLLVLFQLMSTHYGSAQEVQNKRDSLINLGYIDLEKSEVFYTENWDSCFYYTFQAMEKFKGAEFWDGYVDMISGVSGIYYYKGDYEHAEKYNQLAIEKALSLLGPESNSYAYALNTKGLLHLNKGNYKATIKNLIESYELIKKNGAENLENAIALANIGDVYRRKGDYNRSINYLKQANDYYQRTDQNQGVVIDNILIIAKNLLSLKDYEQSVAFSKKAIELVRQSKNDEFTSGRLAYAYLNLAENYRLQENFDKCNYFLNKLDQIKIIKGETNLDTQSEIHQEYGALYLAQKNYPKALEAFQQSLTINTQQYAKYQHHPKRAEDYQNIAECYLAEGKTAKAIEQYQKALQTLALGFSESDPQKNPTIENMLSLKIGFPILQGKARALFQQFQKNNKTEYLQNSLSTYHALGNLIDKARSGFTSEDSKLFLLANAQSVFEEGIQAALALYQQNQEARFLEKAFQFAESNKAILMQESLTSDQALDQVAISDSLRIQEADLSADIAFYERKVLETRNKNNADDGEQLKLWEGQLFDLKQEYQGLQTQLEKNYPHYQQLKQQSEAISIQHIQQNYLNKGELLLEYFDGKQDLYLFAIGKNKAEVFVIPQKEVLMQKVEALLPLLSQPPNSGNFIAELAQFNQQSHALYQQLLAPALKEAGPISRLVIVPDAELNYLPFEVLQFEHNEAQDYRLAAKNYLIENYEVSYLFSSALLAQDKSKRSSTVPFVGFAPSFQRPIAEARSCSQSELYGLQCNQSEVASINKHFSGQIFSKEAANKNNFLQHIEAAGIIHLATHACVNLDEAALSQIFFSDDYLTAVELKNLDLSADLAVLSACNTGSGKMEAGEGLMSLSRSFTIAGCPSTLMSLWAVDDCATSQMMIEFYEQLNAGHDKATAIRNTKLNYLQEASKAQAHPYYWSAFVLSGSTQAVFSTSSNWFIYGSIVLLGLLLLTWGGRRRTA